MANFPNMVFLACALSGAPLVGCGLVDSDIADFSLTLPEKDVRIDSAQWQLTEDATLPEVSCAGNEAVCALAAETVCQSSDEAQCFAACEPTPETCMFTIAFSLWNTIELDKEAPELESINGAPIGRVTVSRIFYRVSENSFSTDAPPLTVAVAPQGVTIVGDPQARVVGTIAPIPAGQSVESMDVEFTEDGLDHLRDVLRDYTTPFNLIVGGEVELSAGDDIPTGRLTAVVQVEATAGL